MQRRLLHSQQKPDHQIGFLTNTSLHQTLKAPAESNLLREEEVPAQHRVSAIAIERENIMLKRKLAERDHEISILKQLLLYK